MATHWISALQDLHEADAERCGGKAASLGRLTRMGVAVPAGFCILAEALDHTLDANGLRRTIAAIAEQLDFDDFAKVEAATADIRELIAQAALDDDLRQQIVDRYQALVSAENPFVAVRSSVAVRDTAITSFPGMMDTYHYVRGAEAVLDKVRECWASLWSSRAAYLRHHKRIPHHQAVIAPVVQLMVNPDTAGVLFTANPVTKDRDEVMIEANWGLGESVVSGRSMNDYFVLDKRDLALRQKKVARKTLMVVMDSASGAGRIEVGVPPDRATLPTLDESQLKELAATGKRIEDDYGFNVDVEWAYQGPQLYILQARRIRDLQD